MEVTFNDVVPTSRGGKKDRQIGSFHIDIEKCEDGIQDISIFDAHGPMRGPVRFKSIEEWDKLKNAMDRLIIKAQEYSI